MGVGPAALGTVVLPIFHKYASRCNDMSVTTAHQIAYMRCIFCNADTHSPGREIGVGMLVVLPNTTCQCVDVVGAVTHTVYICLAMAVQADLSLASGWRGSAREGLDGALSACPSSCWELLPGQIVNMALSWAQCIDLCLFSTISLPLNCGGCGLNLVLSD